MACGHPQRRSHARQVTATVLFVDLSGSTRLGEQFDAEALRQAMSQYHDTLRTTIEASNGTVIKVIGDAVLAVFGEGEHAAASQAARDIQARLADADAHMASRWGLSLRARVGLQTGIVTADPRDPDPPLIVGDPVLDAIALQSAAPVGGILLGEGTARLVASELTRPAAAVPVRDRGSLRAWLLA